MTITRTLSLKEYAAALMGPGPDGTAATVEEHKIQWLRKRLKGHAKPQLPGYKVARQWRGTPEDVAEAIELLRPPRAELPAIPQVSSMTRTSRRRLTNTRTGRPATHA